MQILARTLFPTVIWTTYFDDQEELNRSLLERAYAYRQRDTKGVANTNVSGWQSPSEIQRMDEFNDICVRLDQICHMIGTSQEFAQDIEYRLEAWVNINPPGASNANHIHPNCHLSGVYYIQTPPKCGNIFFRDPRTPGLMVRPPVVRENEYTATEASMQAKAGRTFIFPAWLEHGVQVNRSDTDRVGISFNVRVGPRPRGADGVGPAHEPDT